MAEGYKPILPLRVGVFLSLFPIFLFAVKAL